MTHALRRTSSVLFTALFALLPTACDVTIDHEWDEFREAHRMGTTELFVVDRDIVVTEAQLLELFEAVQDDEGESVFRATVAKDGAGHRAIWNTVERQNLTFCISDDFGAQKARAHENMFTATREWETVANVRFRYDPAQDSNCDESNSHVLIPVRPMPAAAKTPGLLASAFWKGITGVPKELRIDYEQIDLQPNPTFAAKSTVLHEVGHVLGLRHEHLFGARCNEEPAGSPNVEMLTPYDVNSIMHYPHCDGTTQSGKRISMRDISGISQLYGPRRFSITSDLSGRCVEFPEPNNGADARQWDCNPFVGQEWTLEVVEPFVGEFPRYFKVVNERTHKCLDVAGHETANGTRVWQWDCIDPVGDNQLWYFDLGTAPGTVRLRSKQSDKCLDLWGFNRDNGGELKIHDCNMFSNQDFRLEHFGTHVPLEIEPLTRDTVPALPAENRNVRFNLNAPGAPMRLDVEGASREAGANVWLWDANSSDAQEFHLVPLGDGVHAYIVNAGSSMCLEVGNDPSDGDNQNVYQTPCNGGQRQQFKFGHLTPHGLLFQVSPHGRDDLFITVQNNFTSAGTNVRTERTGETGFPQWIISNGSSSHPSL